MWPVGASGGGDGRSLPRVAERRLRLRVLGFPLAAILGALRRGVMGGFGFAVRALGCPMTTLYATRVPLARDAPLEALPSCDLGRARWLRR